MNNTIKNWPKPWGEVVTAACQRFRYPDYLLYVHDLARLDDTPAGRQALAYVEARLQNLGLLD